jgi:hypothetical protein
MKKKPAKKLKKKSSANPVQKAGDAKMQAMLAMMQQANPSGPAPGMNYRGNPMPPQMGM